MTAPQTARPPRELPDLDGSEPVALTIADDSDHADVVVGSIAFDGGQTEAVTLDRVVLRGVDLSFARLVDLRLRDVVFQTCDLSNLVLVDPSLIRVVLRDCRTSGLTLEGGMLEDVRASGCRGDVVSFVDVVATRLTIDACQWPEADFRATRIADLLITSSELPRSQWVRARLASGRVTGTNLDSVKGASGLAGISIDQETLWSAAAGLADGLGVAVWDDPVDDGDTGSPKQ